MQKTKAILTEFADIFMLSNSSPGLWPDGKFNIDTEGHSPINTRNHQMSDIQHERLAKATQKLLAEGKIEKSVSSWNFPSFNVPKKFNPVIGKIEYRLVNEF